MLNWMRWLVVRVSRCMRYSGSSDPRTSQQMTSASRRAPVYRKLPSGDQRTCDALHRAHGAVIAVSTCQPAYQLVNGLHTLI